MPPATSSDRVIVALDTATADDARALAARLAPPASFFKLGLGLLADGCLDLTREMRDNGLRVFLDLKLFDIPSTVRRAVRAIVGTARPSFLSVHGDPQVVKAAADGRNDAGADTRILAVTVLTSMDRDALAAAMLPSTDVAEVALERGRRAMAAGADGLVAAPTDLAALRQDPATAEAVIVTPGIRLEDGDAHEQARTATPSEALAAGADYIVIGRPILQATDSQAMLQQVLDGFS